jgi:hypothetical protein
MILRYSSTFIFSSVCVLLHDQWIGAFACLTASGRRSVWSLPFPVFCLARTRVRVPCSRKYAPNLHAEDKSKEMQEVSVSGGMKRNAP